MLNSIDSAVTAWTIHSRHPLRGSLVTLEPLSWRHLGELLAIVGEETIWHFLTTCASTEDALERYVTDALKARDDETEIPFVVRWHQSQELAGFTRLKHYSRQHRRAQVGSWFIPTVWGRGANTESKLMLLGLAFERLGCLRVEFNADSNNLRSRAALIALGAKEEGTLRSWGITHRGGRRDNVVFSILAEEWQESKERLGSRLKEVMGDPRS